MNFHVYVAFNAERECLYVGQTKNLRQRMSWHRTNSGWYDRTCWIETFAFDTREEALIVESERIWSLRPLHNTQGNPRRSLLWSYVDEGEGPRQEQQRLKREALRRIASERAA